MSPNNKLSIKQWAEEDRPREKLLRKGRSSLSDVELLAILLGSGTYDVSAIDLSRRLLKENGNSLSTLAKRSVEELCKFKGVGEAKSVTIIAALELGRRHKDEDPKVKAKIVESKAGYEYIVQELQDLDHEQFWIILLNRTNFIIGKQMVSRGGRAGTIVDPKIIFKIALDHKAHGLILCHNHPSGSVKPSQSDVQLTQKLSEAGKLLDISVLDHLIISDKKYYSFADEGLMS